MAEYEIEYPKGSGELYDITAPDDATDAQIEKAFFAHLSKERGAAGNVLRTGEYAVRGAIDTGAEVRVPLFIDTGDKIKIDIQKGAYVERIKS